MVGRVAVVFLAVVITFLSTATWAWDELIGTPRPKVIEWLARLHWYGFVMIGMSVLIYLIGEAAYCPTVDGIIVAIDVE
jgi:hypothetical protein